MYVIVGLGKTGFSVAHFLEKKNIDFVVFDTRSNPPELERFRQEFSTVEIFLNDIPEQKILSAKCIVLSPGLSRQTSFIQLAIKNQIPVIGDIELFVREAAAPIIAVTGTNAKGTVTTMTATILEAAGKKVFMGGNIGIPALDLLAKETPDFYVMELSSFQLESTFSLHPIAATILNITPDHLDYHDTLEAYQAAKLRIYRDARNIIFNQDDDKTICPQISDKQMLWSFGLGVPEDKYQYGIRQIGSEYWLCNGDEKILAVNEMPVMGRHNWLNALAACALARAVGVPLIALQQGLKNFKGLHHRCEFVLERRGVRWINDSKGTNVGATQAALSGIGSTLQGKIVLIAGGQGKGQDFSLLVPLCRQYVKSVVLFGQDAKLLEAVLGQHVACIQVNNLAEAVLKADSLAAASDVVLLSPVCASWDMFRDYSHRGDEFVRLVNELQE